MRLRIAVPLVELVYACVGDSAREVRNAAAAACALLLEHAPVDARPLVRARGFLFVDGTTLVEFRLHIISCLRLYVPCGLTSAQVPAVLMLVADAALSVRVAAIGALPPAAAAAPSQDHRYAFSHLFGVLTHPPERE